jgi:hypothetical protein
MVRGSAKKVAVVPEVLVARNTKMMIVNKTLPPLPMRTRMTLDVGSRCCGERKPLPFDNDSDDDDSFDSTKTMHQYYQATILFESLESSKGQNEERLAARHEAFASKMVSKGVGMKVCLDKLGVSHDRNFKIKTQGRIHVYGRSFTRVPLPKAQTKTDFPNTTRTNQPTKTIGGNAGDGVSIENHWRTAVLRPTPASVDDNPK